MQNYVNSERRGRRPNKLRYIYSVAVAPVSQEGDVLVGPKSTVYRKTQCRDEAPAWVWGWWSRGRRFVLCWSVLCPIHFCQAFDKLAYTKQLKRTLAVGVSLHGLELTFDNHAYGCISRSSKNIYKKSTSNV